VPGTGKEKKHFLRIFYTAGKTYSNYNPDFFFHGQKSRFGFITGTGMLERWGTVPTSKKAGKFIYSKSY